MKHFEPLSINDNLIAAARKKIAKISRDAILKKGGVGEFLQTLEDKELKILKAFTKSEEYKILQKWLEFTEAEILNLLLNRPILTQEEQIEAAILRGKYSLVADLLALSSKVKYLKS